MTHLFMRIGLKTAWALFLSGIFLCLAMAAGMVFASLEADFYGFAAYSSELAVDLRCPRLIAGPDQMTIQAVVTNQTDRPIRPLMRADISSRGRIRSERQWVDIQPGETRVVEWTVSARDQGIRGFSFARVYRYSVYQMPMAEKSCGMMVWGTFPWAMGSILYALWFLGGIGALFVGQLVLQERLERQERLSQAVRIQAVLALLALLVAHLGFWMFGILLLGVAALAFVSYLNFAYQT